MPLTLLDDFILTIDQEHVFGVDGLIRLVGGEVRVNLRAEVLIKH